MNYPAWPDLQQRFTEKPNDDFVWSTLSEFIAESARGLTIRLGLKLDSNELDDIIQDSLLSVHTSNILARPNSSYGYIYVVVKNSIFDFLRFKSRSIDLARTYEAELSLVTTGPSGVGGNEDLRARLARALKRLSKGDRRLIYDRFLREMSIGEIARKSLKTYSATGTAIFRALERLRQGIVLQRIIDEESQK